MTKATNRKWLVEVLGLSAALVLLPLAASGQDSSALLKDALNAAWPGMAAGATVVDWEGNVLQEGSNGWTCLPTAPNLTDEAPMCLDAEWLKWANAWQTKGAYEAGSLGIAYMLAGDGGASNTDPYAEGPTDDIYWIRLG